MSKFFMDCEFHEYEKKPLFGKPINTIELISIGIVSGEKLESGLESETEKLIPCPKFYFTSKMREDAKQRYNKGESVKMIENPLYPKYKAKEYYAICKEFDLKAAWNNEWLRENVLISIHKDLCSMVGTYGKTYHWKLFEDFTYKSMKNLLNWYGKTKKQIASEVETFVWNGSSYPETSSNAPEFYAYYADYDWVVFCWLFGRMIDLPKGFPMFAFDLKQMLDEKAIEVYNTPESYCSYYTPLEKLLDHCRFPKQTNEHNALADALFNKELYYFLQNL